MKMTIKAGDTAVVITGKDKGKQGKVVSVDPETGRVTIEGVNLVKRHTKPKSQQDKGGIISKIAPIDASNVMIVCPNCGKPSRVGHAEVGGKKVRVCKKCGTSLDKEYVKASKKEAKKATEKTAEKKESATAEKKESAKTKKSAQPKKSEE